MLCQSEITLQDKLTPKCTWARKSCGNTSEDSEVICDIPSSEPAILNLRFWTRSGDDGQCLNVNCFLSPVSFHCVCARLPFSMQSSDGTPPWCPGQSLWCLIAEHISGSELPKIQAALGTSLVSQYRDLHAEVSPAPRSCLKFPLPLWEQLAGCMLCFLLTQSEERSHFCPKPSSPAQTIYELWLLWSVVSGLLWLRTLNNYNSLTIVKVECGSNVPVLLRSKPDRHRYLLQTCVAPSLKPPW